MDPKVKPARTFSGSPSPDAIHQPSAVYLTGEESLRISSIGNASGITLTLRGRALRPDDDITPIEMAHTPNSNRTLASSTAGLPEGWLLGLVVFASAGTPAFGAVWVRVELVRGQGSAAVVLQELGYGFVTAIQPYIWPNGENFLASDGPGQLRSISGTTPGAGAEISETVPAGARWELIAFRAQLVASATVANRLPQLRLDDGTNDLYYAPANTAVTASQTVFRNYLQGLGQEYSDSRLNFHGPLPSDNRLGPGYRIRTNTLNLQAGDQWSAVQYLVRERFDV